MTTTPRAPLHAIRTTTNNPSYPTKATAVHPTGDPLAALDVAEQIAVRDGGDALVELFAIPGGLEDPLSPAALVGFLEDPACPKRLVSATYFPGGGGRRVLPSLGVMHAAALAWEDSTHDWTQGAPTLPHDVAIMDALVAMCDLDGNVAASLVPSMLRLGQRIDDDAEPGARPDLGAPEVAAASASLREFVARVSPVRGGYRQGLGEFAALATGGDVEDWDAIVRSLEPQVPGGLEVSMGVLAVAASVFDSLAESLAELGEHDRAVVEVLANSCGVDRDTADDLVPHLLEAGWVVATLADSAPAVQAPPAAMEAVAESLLPVGVDVDAVIAENPEYARGIGEFLGGLYGDEVVPWREVVAGLVAGRR